MWGRVGRSRACGCAWVEGSSKHQTKPKRWWYVKTRPCTLRRPVVVKGAHSKADGGKGMEAISLLVVRRLRNGGWWEVKARILGLGRPQSQQQRRAHPHHHRNRTSMYNASSWSRRLPRSKRPCCLLIAEKYLCGFGLPRHSSPSLPPCLGQPTIAALRPVNPMRLLATPCTHGGSSCCAPRHSRFLTPLPALPHTQHSAARPSSRPQQRWCAKRWTTGCGP